jgi:hypothetical protein
MKRLLTCSPAQLLLLGLVALLLFGNCSQNVYRVLGPGTTAQQVRRLKRLDDSLVTAYQAAYRRPPNVPGPTPQQLADSANAARRRLLSPAQYQRYSAKRTVLPFRYPRRPPRDMR